MGLKLSHQNRTLLVMAGAMVAGILAVWLAADVFSGDPGGRILAQLKPAAAALPDDARVIYRHDSEPEWSSCDGMPGTFGWSSAVVHVRFSTATQGVDLLRLVDERLKADGWQLQWPQVWPLAPHWVWKKTLKNGTTASVAMEQDWYDQNWTLFAHAAPVGRMVSGC